MQRGVRFILCQAELSIHVAIIYSSRALRDLLSKQPRAPEASSFSLLYKHVSKIERYLVASSFGLARCYKFTVKLVWLQHQALFRGFADRRDVRVLRAQLYELELRRLQRERAAVVVQACARGRAARLAVAQKRASISEALRREEGRLTIQVPPTAFHLFVYVFPLQGKAGVDGMAGL